MQATPRARTRLLAAAAALTLAGALGGCAAMGIETPLPSFTGFGGGGPQAAPQIEQVFVASTRKGDSGADADKIAPNGLRYELDTLTLPPGHRPGVIEQPMWGAADPRKDIALQGVRTLDPTEFDNELASHISGRIGVNRDVLVYVHGFNTSLDTARLSAAQIAADSHFGGVTVLFSWPSKAQLFDYVSDKDSAMASRDSLQQLISDLSETPGVGKIHVLAHSMGAWLAMEALRQETLAGNHGLDGHLGDVMLASPDIDMDVFASQMEKLRPADVTVFASSKDRALSISSALADSRLRVGAIDPHNPADRERITALGARVYDLTKYADGFIGHDAYESAPQVLASIGAAMSAPRAADVSKVSITDATDMTTAPEP